MTIVFAGLARSLVLLGVGLISPWAAIGITLFWGGFAFGNVPPLLAYVVQIAREVSPEATDVASGINIGAFNLGIAFGAWVGGHVVQQIGLQAAPFVGAAIVVSGILLVRRSGALERKANGREVAFECA